MPAWPDHLRNRSRRILSAGTQRRNLNAMVRARKRLERHGALNLQEAMEYDRRGRTQDCRRPIAAPCSTLMRSVVPAAVALRKSVVRRQPRRGDVGAVDGDRVCRLERDRALYPAASGPRRDPDRGLWDLSSLRYAQTGPALLVATVGGVGLAALCRRAWRRCRWPSR